MFPARSARGPSSVAGLQSELLVLGELAAYLNEIGDLERESHALYSGWSLQTRNVILSAASARISSQYGCCSRVSLGVAFSTCTCTRADAAPFCVARRISVSVSKFIVLPNVSLHRARRLL